MRATGGDLRRLDGQVDAAAGGSHDRMCPDSMTMPVKIYGSWISKILSISGPTRRSSTAAGSSTSRVKRPGPGQISTGA